VILSKNNDSTIGDILANPLAETNEPSFGVKSTEFESYRKGESSQSFSIAKLKIFGPYK